MAGPPDRIAFIHFAKAAGRYVDQYLIRQVFDATSKEQARQKYKIHNSWRSGLRRDWTEEELVQLAGNRHPAQLPALGQVRVHHELWTHDYLAKQYVHNHHHNWSARSVEAFRRNGWFTFMFLRDPAELLCSLWTWANQSVRIGRDPSRILRPECLIRKSLDDFVQIVLSERRFAHFYALPEYIDKIDFVRQFSAENFRRFLEAYFDHPYQPLDPGEVNRFPSNNPGYTAYRSRGDISDATGLLLDSHELVQAVRARF